MLHRQLYTSTIHPPFENWLSGDPLDERVFAMSSRMAAIRGGGGREL